MDMRKRVMSAFRRMGGGSKCQVLGVREIGGDCTVFGCGSWGAVHTNHFATEDTEFSSGMMNGVRLVV